MSIAGPAVVAGMRDFRVIAVFCGVTLVWGSTWYVIKDQIGLAPIGWTVAFRFAVAAVATAALALVRGESLRLPRSALGVACWVGLLQFCLNFQFVYRAEESITSGIMAVIMAVMVVPTVLLARIFFGSAVQLRFLAGSAVALAGIGLLLLREYQLAPPHGAVGAGMAFGIAAMIVSSVASVVQLGRAARAVPTAPLVAWSLAIGAMLDIAYALVTVGPPPLDLPGRFWIGVAYLGLVGSALPFPLFVWLIRRIGAARAAYVNVAVPVIAMLISTLQEGYHWTGLAISGAILAITGLLIALGSRGE